MFSLPITVAATFILWRYKDLIPTDDRLRNAVGVLIAVGWTILRIAFVLGAAITKLMPV